MRLPDAANVVVLASNYNPSIVSKEWLAHTGILADTDERKLQLTVRKITEDNLVASGGIAERFVDALPETPYKAIGLNYSYALAREKCELGAILSPKGGKIRELFSPRYEVGTTIVFEFEDFIVTFAVSPSLRNERRIQVRFNFHSDIANTGEVKERLCSRASTLEKAETIIQGLSSNE